MKKIFDAVMGDTKTPAKKFTAIAAFITAGLLALALIVLIISSIAFAIADSGSDAVSSGDSSGGDASGDRDFSASTSYKTTTFDANQLYTGELLILDSTNKLNANSGNSKELVSLSDKRSKFDSDNDADRYYATTTSDKLVSGAQKALDSMLVAFYNANKSALVTDKDASGCNIPFATKTDKSGLTFQLLGYDEKTSYNVSTYKWIYDNAYKYGFIYEEDNFRYVGVAHSTYMKTNAKNVPTLDKYMDLLKQKTYTSALSVKVGNVTYKVYYIAKGAEAYVPSNFEYTVSGNNVDGYIVTVDTSKSVKASDTSGAAG